ncbi:MAG: ABC transporter permease [Vicinamibacterales bacterium]
MRFYRLLARLFPRAFRRQYEEELAATAADLMRAEGSQGPLHRARLWVGLSTDAVTRGLAERRAEGGRSLLRSLATETRQALRVLAGRPGFSAIVIALLGLVMSANAAVFGVVNATLLRPLPYANPDRLVMLWESYAPMKMDTMPWSDPDYTSVSAATAFDGTALFRFQRYVLTGDANSVSVRAVLAENTLFAVLGATADRGRLFTDADRETGAGAPVVLSYDAWVSRFHKSPAIVGTSILLDNQPRTVIGVLRPGLSFPPPISFGGQMLSSEPELYLPYTINRDPASRGAHSGFVVARLRDDAGMPAAQAEVAAIAARLEREFPDLNTDIRMHVAPLHGQSVVLIRRALYVMLVAVGGVLLIACASIANLLLARASGRAREMALRTALGASRASLVRQLLIESVLLGIGGTAVGLLGAQSLSTVLMTLNPIELPNMFQSALDWRVLGFTTAMTLTSVIVFGLVPALAGSRADLVSMLRSGTRTTVGQRERRAKSALVVLQVSLAVVLLVGSGLMVRSLMRLWQVDPGFRPDGVVTMSIQLPEAQYANGASQRKFQERWLTRLHQIPGVTQVAAMTILPFSFDRSSSDYSVVGAPTRKTGDYLIATYDYVSPEFSQVLQIPVIEGRGLLEGDADGAPPVALISESLARLHWQAGAAVGHQLLFGNAGTETPKTIVGVVRDVRLEGFEGRFEPTIYVPQAQSPARAFWTALSSTRPAEAVAAEVRAALHDIDPGLPAGEIRPLTGIMADTVKQPRFTAVVISAFAIVALLIAAIGLYGVLAFDVAQQRRELGVRVALGATPQGIRALVLGRGFRLVAIGVVVGVATSAAGSRLIAGLLFNAPALDIVPVVAAISILALTTLLATWLPARHATKADPIEALRSE